MMSCLRDMKATLTNKEMEMLLKFATGASLNSLALCSLRFDSDQTK